MGRRPILFPYFLIFQKFIATDNEADRFEKLNHAI